VAELSREARSGRLLTAEPETEAVETTGPEPRVRRLDIVGRRNWFFLLSLIIIIPGIISMVTRGFLLGIDFAGGTEFIVKFQNPPSLQSVESTVARDNINGLVQQAGTAASSSGPARSRRRSSRG